MRRRQSGTDEKLAAHYLRKGELSRSRNVECLTPFQIGDVMHKTLTALAVAATFTIATVAAPQQAEARGGRVAAGIIGGLAAGAIIGGIASQQGYYGGPGYYYSPGPYGYGAGPYAYEPAPVYVQPAPRRYYRGGYGGGNGCWIATDTTRGYGYYGPCY